MAGHLPIGSAGFESAFNNENIESFRKLKDFEKVDFNGNKVMKLPTKDYQMDDEHDNKDDLIISYTPSHGRYLYEVHFNEDNQINEVYLVM